VVDVHHAAAGAEHQSAVGVAVARSQGIAVGDEGARESDGASQRKESSAASHVLRDGAHGDAGVRNVISQERIVVAEGQGAGVGDPENGVVAATIRSGIDYCDRRVRGGRERGADLEYPEHVVLKIGVELECPGQIHRGVKMINAWEKHTPTQFSRCTHSQIVGGEERHSPQTVEGRREIRARLVDDREITRTGGFDRQSWRRNSEKGAGDASCGL